MRDRWFALCAPTSMRPSQGAATDGRVKTHWRQDKQDAEKDAPLPCGRGLGGGVGWRGTDQPLPPTPSHKGRGERLLRRNDTLRRRLLHARTHRLVALDPPHQLDLPGEIRLHRVFYAGVAVVRAQ